MRAAVLMLVIAAAFIVAPADAQYCEERCFHDSYSSRMRCRVRCWRPPPRYVPPPAYQPEPQHFRPHYGPPGAQIDVATLGIGFIILVIIAVMAGVLSDPSSTDIDEIEQAALSARAQTQEAESKTQAINTYIAEAEADAFQRGRNAADAEWDEFTRHD